jgi:hypothetical protein
MRVTIDHFRTVPGFGPKPGFCASGGRAWFKRHRLDWSAFVKGGIDAEQLLATGDGLAQALVAHAHQQEATRGR